MMMSTGSRIITSSGKGLHSLVSLSNLNRQASVQGWCMIHAKMSSQVIQSPDSKDKPKPEDVHTGNISEVRVSASNRQVLFKYGAEGKYKSIEDVPEFVSRMEIDNARSRRRVKINLKIMVFALCVAFGSIFYAKYDMASGGKTWVEQNMEKKQKAREDFQLANKKDS